jgi:hypothetical protein
MEHAERFAENDLNDSDDRSTLTVVIRRQPIGATILAAFVQRFVASARVELWRVELAIR